MMNANELVLCFVLVCLDRAAFYGVCRRSKSSTQFTQSLLRVEHLEFILALANASHPALPPYKVPRKAMLGLACAIVRFVR